MKKLLFILSLCIGSLLQASSIESSPISVIVKGEGNPIIFIPGFTVPGEIWNPVVDELSATYQCHVVTLAGFGGTAPVEFPWLPKVNDALDQYISQNNLKDVTIIGHSLGGTVATWLASRDNNKVKQIILVDALPAAGALMIPDYNPDNLAYESPYNDQQLEMNDEQFEQMASMMSSAMSLKKEGQEKVQQWMMQADRKTYVYGYTDYLKLDLREDLKKITIPVHIIAATQPYGADMVKQTNQTQYANLASYDLVMAPDAAHFIMLDQPEWFMNEINKILGNN